MARFIKNNSGGMESQIGGDLREGVLGQSRLLAACSNCCAVPAAPAKTEHVAPGSPGCKYSGLDARMAALLEQHGLDGPPHVAAALPPLRLDKGKTLVEAEF